MNNTVNIVDEIVARVLAELSPAPSRPDQANQPAKSLSTSDNIIERTVSTAEESGLRSSGNSTVTITDNVVTAETLSKKLSGTNTVIFAPRTVLTPSARDFISKHNINWSRCDRAIDTQNSKPVRCHALIVNSTPAIKQALAEMATVESTLADSVADASQRAISMICRSDCDVVVVFSDLAEMIACLANRNHQVRGAVANDANDAKSQQKSLGVNVLAVKPSLLSYVQVRNILSAVIGGGVPSAPDDWPE